MSGGGYLIEVVVGLYMSLGIFKQVVLESCFSDGAFFWAAPPTFDLDSGLSQRGN